jgi:ubiquinone biosynthesis protein COQ9
LVAIEPRPGGEVFTAALEQLTEAGRESTTLGKMALALAARLDANQDSGGAMASMAKQLEATLESATKGANVVASPMDELRARRAAKHA